MNDVGQFPPEEYERRRREVRQKMALQGIDALLISTPENIFYLCGLDHMGYFAFQMLILPAHGTPILVTRAMERATVQDQVRDLIHYGYSDGSRLPPSAGDPKTNPPETVDLLDSDANVFVEPTLQRHKRGRPGTEMPPVEETCNALAAAGLGGAHLALEEGGSFITPRIAQGIMSSMSDATWSDGTGIVDEVRIVQSELELRCTRRAATISDAMLQAGMAASGLGVNKREVMAAIYDAMFRRGGTYPAFVPLVRSNTSLVHEHGTWDDTQLSAEEILFLEISGCVRRYHAPMGRLVFINSAPASAYRAHDICEEALIAASKAIRSGVLAGDVYAAWHSVLDRHGLDAYKRHHCGYSTGIGYPPSWSGGGAPRGLRPESDMRLKSGMVFHLMSWLLRSDYGDSFISDAVVVTDEGCEFLTQTPRQVYIRY
jgi:Xaa-Pro aminopeptidase